LYDSVYMNSLLVPRGSKVSVLIDRVDERFSDLFYSKLIKEFKLSQITDSDLKEEFVAENIARDRVYFDELERKTSSNILSRGKTVSDSMFSGIYMWFQENFTLFESKKEQWHADRKQAYLQDAVYYADTNQVDKSVEALQSFNSLNGGFREDMFDEEFLLYSVDDPKYLVSMNVLEQAYLAGYERSVLNELWLDVYEAISINNVFAEKSLQKYFKYLDKYLANNDLAPVELELFLAYQNQLLRNLFIKSPVMYKEEYLLKKYDLERELLGNYDEFLRKDLSQDYVNYKIIYIKRLMKFFFDDEIKVSDAAAALSRLVKEINELMPQETSTKALFEFFDEQLKDIGDFWGYLKSPEYNSTRVYGATHKERYEVYLEERQKLWSFIDVQQEVIGEVLESELSVDDIEAEVRAVFDQNENIKSLILGSILSADQRYVEVKGNILGYSFEADYDRDFEALVNVFVYGELISEDPVKLENLIRVVEQRFSELTDVEVSDDEDDLTQIETHAQRVARIYIAGVIEKAGFVLDESNVGLIDTGKSLYAISNVYLEGYDDILVTFDYNATKELSENLYFVYKDKPIVLEDRYSLVQIKEMIREGIENLDQYDDKQPRSRAVSR
ncbi:hypothetical protein KJ632_02890, partial [Patescibacteria group bacterium]|nr:hypothetical protein [Patescibacteria group bacterium]